MTKRYFRIPYSTLVSILLLASFLLRGQDIAIRPIQTTRALIVGISNYQNEKIIDLKYADKDAQVFANFLQNETAWKVDPDNLVLLTNEKATYGQFINELDVLVKNSQPKDRFILYFSGHGDWEEVTNRKEGYLLFHDVGATTYAAGGACLVTLLNEYIHKLVLEKQTEVILISDACRSGTLAGSTTGGPAITTTALSTLFENTTKIMSCEPSQLSLEGQWGGGRGLFSFFLVDGLRGLADSNKDQYIKLYELERFVKRRVLEESEEQQLPMVIGSGTVQLTRVLDGVARELELPINSEPIIASDTNYLELLVAFQNALRQGHYLYPQKGSAYQIYQSIGNSPAAQAIKNTMKVSLGTELQNETQQAINAYIQTPGKEIARRWKNGKTYKHYPEYLEVAATLLGEDNPFYKDIKAREYYFRGLNLRLKAEETRSEETLNKALEELQKALQYQPMAPHVYNELGLTYRRLKKRPEELAAFQVAQATSPNWVLALTNLGYSYQLKEEYDKAEAYYLKAISLDAEFTLAYYNLSTLYLYSDKLDAAVDYAKKVIELAPMDPAYAEAYYAIAYVYVDYPEKHEVAKDMLLAYISLNPNSDDGFSLLGFLYNTMGDLPKAQQAYEAALSLEPFGLYSIRTLYSIYIRSGATQKARALLQKSIKQDKAESDYNIGLVSRLIELDALEAAIEVLQWLLQGELISPGLLDKEEFNSVRTLPAFKGLQKK